MAFIGNRFILTLHAVSLGATPSGVGFLLGMVMLGPLLLSVHYGRWSDRWGYGPLCAIALALIGLACVVAAAFANLPALYVASALTGSGYMLAFIAIMNAVGKLTRSDEMSRAFSVLSLGFSLSPLASPLICGSFIDAFGHRCAYLAMVAFVCASGATFWWSTRKYAVPVQPERAPGATRFIDLFRNAPLRTVFIISGLLTMGWDTFTFVAPLHGLATGLSATATGTVVGAFGAGSLVVRLALPWLSGRVSEWRIAALTLFFTAAGYVAFPLMHGFWLLATAAFMLGVSLGSSQPIAMTLIHRTAPPDRVGEAVGVRAAIISLSQTTLPVLFGVLGSAVGLTSVFWLTASMLAVGGVIATRSR